MPYFTIGKIFLFPSYDLSVEEKNIFDIYDKSNIIFTNWGCGHNLKLKILEGQLIISISTSLMPWNIKQFELFIGSSFYYL